MEDIPLFDSPGAQLATIVTDGATIKPILNVLDTVADETKLHITDDGIHTRVTDGANVFMLNKFRVDADAFDTYNVESEGKIGVNVGEFKHMVRRARKHQDDELTITISERELTTTVRRGYDNHNVVSQSETKLIDPASIRREPDALDMAHELEFTVDTRPFMDALEYGTTGHANHIKISVKGVNQHANALYIGGETDNTSESVAVSNIDVDGTSTAMFSTDYVKQIMEGLRALNPDTVGVRLEDEYPAAFRAQSEDLPFSIEYVIAPRIQE
jgi:hypothetical protein